MFTTDIEPLLRDGLALVGVQGGQATLSFLVGGAAVAATTIGRVTTAPAAPARR